jgi:single-strand DNA-binding protein
MPNYNSVVIVGNAVRDPELRNTSSGTALCNITIAINHKYTTDSGEKREDSTFVDVTLWGRLAEIAGQYLHKGEPVFIQGRLQTETWDDKQTGAKRSKLKVVAENLQLLTGRPGAKTQESAPAASKPAPAKQTSAAASDEDPQDIPF